MQLRSLSWFFVVCVQAYRRIFSFFLSQNFCIFLHFLVFVVFFNFCCAPLFLFYFYLMLFLHQYRSCLFLYCMFFLFRSCLCVFLLCSLFCFVSLRLAPSSAVFLFFVRLYPVFVHNISRNWKIFISCIYCFCFAFVVAVAVVAARVVFFISIFVLLADFVVVGGHYWYFLQCCQVQKYCLRCFLLVRSTLLCFS